MSVRVKNIYIELPEYKFCAEDDPIYLGREQAKSDLVKRLKPNGKKYEGAYLVSGYRGMGKTTLVNRVIKELKNTKHTSKFTIKPDCVNEVNVNLAQGNLTEFDVLRQIFIQFSINYKKSLSRFRFKFGLPGVALLVLLAMIGSVVYLYTLYEPTNELIATVLEKGNIAVLLLFSLFFILFTILIKGLIESCHRALRREKVLFINKLNEIEQRINSRLEIGAGNTVNQSFSGMTEGAPLFSKVLSIASSKGSGPFKQSFDKLSSKELENEIKELLEAYYNYQNTKWRYFSTRKRIVFIIDELDKLESELSQSSTYKLDEFEKESNSRKQTISKVLASLKNFINTANAKFVFIGGAEMYEASLADVADRESFYSSIFNEVIYINTFFKDFENRKTGLTQMVESYLVQTLLGKRRIIANKDYNLKYLYNQFMISQLDANSRDYLIYHLYRFSIYLAYRSNGSPKKLKELIEYYILADHTVKDKRAIVLLSHNSGYEIVEGCFPNSSKNIRGTFLKFNYQQLYKIGLLSSIYLPYIINNQRHQKIFNDKNLYLNAFLMDHILKFHRSAFSWRELELMPDIILGSKGPNLRETLKETLKYLSKVHIRETSNSLFQYKFRSRSEMELRYISKISDESAAAYNFTFDESYHLKAFFKKKLLQKIENYKNLNSHSTQYIHTLGYLNSTIADIHFYDEEYDSAIRYYSDTIQRLREHKYKLSNHQKVLLIRNKLSLSLCLEKTHRYESAYSIIRTVLLDLQTDKFNFGYELDQQFNELQGKRSWDDAYKRMQLFLRPHIALLMVFEKERSDGITASNLKRNIEEYTKFLGVRKLYPLKRFNKNIDYRKFLKKSKNGDHKRIQTLLADYYQNVGSILFYKNRSFKSILETSIEDILVGYMGVTGVPGKNILDFRKHYNKSKTENYHPTILPLFYYIISAGHLVTPYLENIESLFQNSYQKLNTSKIIEILDLLAYDKSVDHALNGKQKASIGLICSKISDTILSIIGNIKLSSELIKVKPKLFFCKGSINENMWGLIDENNKIDYNRLFSLNSIFYFNILSYQFFKSAGRYYDALLSLKKCLYVIRTHVISASEGVNTRNKLYKNNNQFLYKLTNEIAKKCEDLIRSEGLGVLNKDHKVFSEITQKKFKYYGYQKYSDGKEVLFLKSRIKIELKSMLDDSSLRNNIFFALKDEKNIIDNIFTRVQKLRFHSFTHYKYHNEFLKLVLDNNIFDIVICATLNTLKYDWIDSFNVLQTNCIDFKELLFSIAEVDLCFRNLESILKTYGYTYIMSYSYSGSLYLNISKWATIVDYLEKKTNSGIFKEKWNLSEGVKIYEVKAIDFFNKAIRLHSGGSEYKQMVKDLYILEDDQNDGLSHFCAALERSVINTGLIDSKLAKLK